MASPVPRHRATGRSVSRWRAGRIRFQPCSFNASREGLEDFRTPPPPLPSQSQRFIAGRSVERISARLAHISGSQEGGLCGSVPIQTQRKLGLAVRLELPMAAIRSAPDRRPSSSVGSPRREATSKPHQAGAWCRCPGAGSSPSDHADPYSDAPPRAFRPAQPADQPFTTGAGTNRDSGRRDTPGARSARLRLCRSCHQGRRLGRQANGDLAARRRHRAVPARHGAHDRGSALGSRRRPATDSQPFRVGSHLRPRLRRRPHHARAVLQRCHGGHHRLR